MRARLALAPVLIALALTGMACGGDDGEESGAAPTPAAATGNAPQGADPDAPVVTPETAPETGMSADQTLSQQISSNPDLRTLSTLVNAAGLTSALDTGRYTVFAPSNDAFIKLGTQLDTLLQPSSKAQLAEILKFHLVEGKLRSKRLTDGRLLTTLQGTRLRVTMDGDDLLIGNSIGKATVQTPDARAKNGIIHTIDTVLKPKPPR